MVTATQAPPEVHRDLRDSIWFRAGVVVVIVAALALLATRALHRDVVNGWEVLATCPAASDAAAPAVSSSVDAAACRQAPVEILDARGWPVLAVTLPASAGTDPTITRVRSDKAARTVKVEYDAGGSRSDADALVFIEVPRSSLPDVPFSVEGAHGPVVVTSVPSG